MELFTAKELFGWSITVSGALLTILYKMTLDKIRELRYDQKESNKIMSERIGHLENRLNQFLEKRNDR